MIIKTALILSLGSLGLIGISMIYVKLLDIKNDILSTVLTVIFTAFIFSVIINGYYG